MKEFTKDQKTEMIVAYKRVIEIQVAKEKIELHLRDEINKLSNLSGLRMQNPADVEKEMRSLFGAWVLAGEFVQKEF